MKPWVLLRLIEALAINIGLYVCARAVAEATDWALEIADIPQLLQSWIKVAFIYYVAFLYGPISFAAMYFVSSGFTRLHNVKMALVNSLIFLVHSAVIIHLLFNALFVNGQFGPINFLWMSVFVFNFFSALIAYSDWRIVFQKISNYL
jgi:hypothetical protein